MMKNLIFILACLFSIAAFAQDNMDIHVNQKVTLRFTEYIVYAEISPIDNKIKVDDDLYYSWFSANDIKTTRGGFDGKLLNGAYTEFYLNKNLKQKGNFEYGLKVGEWKNWYADGEIEEICNWKKGKKHGKFREYSKDGKLLKEGIYKGGLQHGKLTVFLIDGSMESIVYEDGVIVSDKKKKRRFKNIFKKKQVDELSLPESPKDKESKR